MPIKISAKFFLYVFLSVVCTLSLSSCGNITGIVPIGVDKMLGEQYSNQLNVNKLQFPVVDEKKNPEVYAYIQKIVNNILASGQIKHKDDFVWDIHVIQDDSTLNAFCVAGGHIYVYTGLIKYLDNESELAGVLAHEIAHADQRHTVNQIVKNYSLSIAIALIIGGDAGFLADIGQQLAGLTFSRSDEADADDAAVSYLYATDYDARGVGGFFKKLTAEKKDTKVPEFLSTHPASENRIEDIEAKWKALGGKEGKTFDTEYQQFKALLN